jgi:hypothetical protein
VLQYHGVAGHDRRDDRVDRRQVRVIPGGDDEDQPQRFAAHEAGEAFLGLGLHVAEGLGRDLDHMAGPLLEAGDLAGGLRNRTAHLPGDFLHDLRLLGDEGIDGPGAKLLPAGHRHVPPVARRRASACQRRVDVRRRSERALHINTAVHRADTA